MALVLKDRVKETTTTTGDGAYTLSGPVTGFQAFSEIGDGNTTYYCCTDGTDFEIGIGTYTASGTTLSRSDANVFESSNNNNRVNWGAGKKDIFVSQPADKAVFLDSAGDLKLDNAHQIKLSSNTSDPVLAIAGSGPNFIRFHDTGGFASTTNAVDIIYRTTPDDLLIERAENANKMAEFGGNDGHVKLLHNGTDRLETTSDGIDITGHIDFPDSTAPNYDNRLRFGAGDDLQIFSDGTNGYMQGTSSNDLVVAFDEVKFLSQDYSTERLHITSAGNVEMSNGSEFMAKFIPNGACELYHDDSLKFNTTTLGTKSTGIHVVEHASGFGAVEVGGPSGGHIDLKAPNSDDYDFRLIHTGSSGLSSIQADDLHLQSVTGAEDYITAALNGAVELYYDNNLRLNTTTDGVTVTGGTGSCNLVILADTDNSDEDDVAKLTLRQDGNNVVGTLGFGGAGVDNPLRLTNEYTGTGSGSGGIEIKTGSDLSARFLTDAGAELYYDGSERLTTASSGIVTKSPVLTNQVTTGDARALFTHTIVGTNNASTQYVKLATLPATSDGTLDHLTLEGQVGGWESHRQGYFRISFSRRSGFNYYYDSYGDIIATAAIQAYTQTDNTVQIWGKFNASNYTKLSYSIPHSFQVTIEENPSLTGTAPSGTLAFDSSSSTYAPRFQVDNAGNLSATTKSFDIAHPTKENMRLRYGSLEGPENGVYVRGRLTGSSVIELPEHWAGLIDEDSITVQLTAIGKSQDLWVEEVSIEQVKVCDANTDCFYMVMAERIDVAKLEVEYAN